MDSDQSKNKKEEELADVIWELNNRPRKVLEYKTAQEVFNEHLNLP